MIHEFLRSKELALRWQVSPATLINWRNENKGPKYIKVGGTIRYFLKDIENIENGGAFKRHLCSIIEPLEDSMTGEEI